MNRQPARCDKRFGRSVRWERDELLSPLSDMSRTDAVRDHGRRLDGVADVAQDLRDLAAQEDECDDRDDRDEGEDQRVLRETLTLGPAELPAQRGQQAVEDAHSDLLTVPGDLDGADTPRTLRRPMSERYAPTVESHMGLLFPCGKHRSSIVCAWPTYKQFRELPETLSRRWYSAPSR